jgi:hypothetical protein
LLEDDLGAISIGVMLSEFCISVVAPSVIWKQAKSSSHITPSALDFLMWKLENEEMKKKKGKERKKGERKGRKRIISNTSTGKVVVTVSRFDMHQMHSNARLACW